MRGFGVVAVAGIVIAYGLWNRAIGSPDSTPMFALKMTAAICVIAAYVLVLILVVEVVEPLWLGLAVALVLAGAGPVAAERFALRDAARVDRVLHERVKSPGE